MDTKGKVLVVDDEAAIRILIKKVLERAGYTVECASDGCEAIAMLAADDYDVVLLDLMMPRLDGYGVVDALKSTHPELLDRTILVTAAHTKQMYSLPIHGVITKPFSLTDLLRETEECLHHDNGNDDACGCRQQAESDLLDRAADAPVLNR